ncbi:hypothetical protein MMC13_006372 [Lambiella insularis]|nr:hypothetical protein [Lambiella insularis]
MSTTVHYPWHFPVDHYKIFALTDRPSDGAIDPKIVMAEQIPQDVVKQEQSVDDPSSADVSATKTTDHTARAVPETSTESHVDENSASSNSNLPEQLEHSINQPSATEGMSDHVNEGSSTITDAPTMNDCGTPQPIHISEENPVASDRESQGNEVIETYSAKGPGVDESISSDTDTSRVDINDSTSKDLEDSQEQIRPNALKKSTTFKPVSVTKSFLAKAGTALTPTAKSPGDKANGLTGQPSPAMQSAPRPRLVAKPASGHRNAVPKALTMGAKAGKGAGPDPNQVWNRNRVSTPQATPKHLTDEELRQQYGIQLASRPQEDADGKEAKWADIDDDEDDWAPETIEWNDGTKINLSQIDRKAALAAEQAAAATAKEKEAEAAKPQLPAFKPTTIVGPNATVLKLGSSTQPKSGGLVLKGPTDKPTLVAKPSSSNQMKSPWASLPPIDKVPPIAIVAQTQTPTSRFAQKDVHGFDAMPPVPTHAKEIAADDFSRAARDVPNGITRELFNSQSGRYEPVKEARRGSTTRREQNFRAPSVLQRPTQGDPRGPAEPSAAFQTSRSGQQDGALWGHRRASSNVSGESGQLDRRGSLGKGFDVPRVPGESHQQRRDSQYEQSPQTPGDHSARFAIRDTSPVHSHGQSITSQSPIVAISQQLSISESAVASPQQSYVQPMIPPTPTSATVPNPEALAAQKRLMHERREAAVKRRKDAEAKEEAEKRERIRIKMEELGLVDGKVGKKELAEEALSSPVLPIEPQEEQLAPRSPPKPPVPNVSGAPQQYGLMKVHSSLLVNGLPAKIAPMERKPLDLMRPKEEAVSIAAAGGPSPPKEDSKPHVNGEVPLTLSEEASIPKSPDPDVQESTPDARQPWNSIQKGPNGYSTWNSTGMTTRSPPGGNLWGPPSHHRALGNGDFQPNMQRQQSRPLPYQPQMASPQPQPIGPPRHLQQSRGPQGQSSGNLSEVPTRSADVESQTVPSFPSSEHVPISAPIQPQGRHQLSLDPEVTRIPTQIRQTPPLVLANSSQPLPPAPVEAVNSGLSAWANFGAATAKLDAERNEKAYQETLARIAEEKQTGISQSSQLPTLNETWRQVKTGDMPGQRQVVGASKTQHKLQTVNQSQQPLGDMPGETFLKSGHMGSLVPQVRSRYQDIFEQNKRVVSAPVDFSRSASASPPPPDSLEHPAYIATSQRPLVNLPGSKPRFTGPRPTVRLPPPVETPPRSTPAPEPRLSNLRAVSQPLAASPSWQDKFNGLFERKHSPEKKFAEISGPASAFSSSKVPLEIASVNPSAAVTLPPLAESGNDREVWKSPQIPPKTVEEEDALFEERDFGSVPTVRVPTRAPVHAWNPFPPPSGYKRHRILSESEIMSVLAFLPGLEATPGVNGLPIVIRIGTMSASKTKILPRSTSHGTLRSKPQNTFKGKPRHNPKPRDSSASFNSPKPPQNGSGRSPVQNVGNHQPRPKTNNSNNNISWARRASTAVK